MAQWDGAHCYNHEVVSLNHVTIQKKEAGL